MGGMTGRAHTGSNWYMDDIATEHLAVMTHKTQLGDIGGESQGGFRFLLMSIGMADSTAHLNSGMQNFSFQVRLCHMTFGTVSKIFRIG
jgi:hypothetical protein